MKFNPGKCQVLPITRERQPLLSQYTLHGQVLETVDSAKYLSLTVSQDLNWNNHINSITGNANRSLGFIKRNVKTKKEAVKELAYKTLVRPQVEYASSVWSPHTKQNISKLEMTQRRAARWVKNNYPPYESISNMLEDLGWRSLENPRIDCYLVKLYKIIYDHVAIQIPDNFKKKNGVTLVTCNLPLLDKSMHLPVITNSPSYNSRVERKTIVTQTYFWNPCLGATWTPL